MTASFAPRAVDRRTPAFVLPAPRAMLMLGAFGMMIGLLVDSRTLAPGALAAICGPANRGLWPLMQLHWALLPWTHVGMWAGGLAAVPVLRVVRPGCRRKYCARVTQNIVCSAWMTVGMSVGALAFQGIGAPSTARFALAMLAGMVCGMATSIALYRLWFRVRPMIGLSFDRRAEVPQR
jgi:hypothetical protein